MQKFSITNRYGLMIVGNLSIPENPIGCAFVEHGLGGVKEQDHIKVLVDTLFSNGYAVVNFDATNSIGESAGKYESATMRLHYEDLVDVITWAKKQEWYKEPFVLAGHSMGGYAVARYAEEYPEEVKAAFPFAPVVSGELSFKATEKADPEKIKKWKETGWDLKISATKPGLEMRLPWSHMEERLKHDLTKKASQLTMPVLCVVGELDKPCPPEHQQIFFDAIPETTLKELHIIKGAPHTFRDKEHIGQLRNIVDAWVKKL